MNQKPYILERVQLGGLLPLFLWSLFYCRFYREEWMDPDFHAEK